MGGHECHDPVVGDVEMIQKSGEANGEWQDESVRVDG
jgi:hypothetical protein